MNARAELRKYVHLLADMWTSRETTDARVEELYGLVRAEVITDLAAEAETRLTAGTSRTVSKNTVLRFLRLEASVVRAAVTGEKSSPDFFQPGHRYALEIWRFHCAAVAAHPTTGERQAIGWIRVSDGSWTAYAYSAAEWGERWTDVTEGGADRG
ncbi:hypothetical protein [Streptomyces sp. M92]|uniref:hypothetical protein n=1 Tax=Streptomyces sp. M92 TaxID=2944250 RepID=UPI00234A6F75|nr:hypothetical protein [Streptomyces sp. M92]WCN06011.1 hypothetical protein M6G08_30210 [Streptomyces sp. M92]